MRSDQLTVEQYKEDTLRYWHDGKIIGHIWLDHRTDGEAEYTSYVVLTPTMRHEKDGNHPVAEPTLEAAVDEMVSRVNWRAMKEQMRSWEWDMAETRRVFARCTLNNACAQDKMMAVAHAQRVDASSNNGRDDLPGLVRTGGDLAFDGHGNGFRLSWTGGRVSVECELGRITRPAADKDEATRVAREIVRDIRAGAL
jgi:hypothetical protein